MRQYDSPKERTGTWSSYRRRPKDLFSGLAQLVSLACGFSSSFRAPRSRIHPLYRFQAPVKAAVKSGWKQIGYIVAPHSFRKVRSQGNGMKLLAQHLLERPPTTYWAPKVVFFRGRCHLEYHRPRSENGATGQPAPPLQHNWGLSPKATLLLIAKCCTYQKRRAGEENALSGTPLE